MLMWEHAGGGLNNGEGRGAGEGEGAHSLRVFRRGVSKGGGAGIGMARILQLESHISNKCHNKQRETERETDTCQ